MLKLIINLIVSRAFPNVRLLLFKRKWMFGFVKKLSIIGTKCEFEAMLYSTYKMCSWNNLVRRMIANGRFKLSVHMNLERIFTEATMITNSKWKKIYCISFKYGNNWERNESKKRCFPSMIYSKDIKLLAKFSIFLKLIHVTVIH